MEHVDTPYFSFLSDDDILLPDFYQDALDGFTKHPEAIFSAVPPFTLMRKGEF